MKKHEKEIEDLKDSLIVQKMINKQIRNKLKKVLDAWECDGIREKDYDLFSQATTLSEVSQ